MRSRLLYLLPPAFALLPIGQAPADTFAPISLASVANNRLQTAFIGYPEGPNVLLGGIPFDIPSGGLNYYNASDAAPTPTSPVSVTIPINLPGVRGVHTLINTFWGEKQSGTLAELRFDFSDASSVTVPLDGDYHMRDFYDNTFTNFFSANTTVNVFEQSGTGPAGPGVYRLDKQFTSLQAQVGKTLQSITLVDNGATEVQRTFLAGLTLQIAGGLSMQIQRAVKISWNGVAGLSYQVQWTTNLDPADWQNLGNVIDGINGQMSCTDVTEEIPRRFYRVINP